MLDLEFKFITTYILMEIQRTDKNKIKTKIKIMNLSQNNFASKVIFISFINIVLFLTYCYFFHFFLLSTKHISKDKK